jgi:hypothetical protein
MFNKKNYIQTLLAKDNSGIYRYYLENCEKMYNLRCMNMPSFIIPPEGSGSSSVVEIMPTVDPNRTSPDFSVIPAENRKQDLLLGSVLNNTTYLFELYQDQRSLQSGHNFVQTEYTKLPRLFETRYFWNPISDTFLYNMGFALTNQNATYVDNAASIPSYVVSKPNFEISLFSGNLTNNASTIIHKRNNNGTYENIPGSTETTYQTSSDYIRLVCDGDILWLAKSVSPNNTPVYSKIRTGLTSNLYYGYYFNLGQTKSLIYETVESGN